MPNEKKDQKAPEKQAGTSGNREESMTESDKDQFGRSRSSGTESLGGESTGAAEKQGPGGVEGEAGER